MQPFSRLCPQCQSPLVSNEVYCRRCNAYSPASDPDTTTFPPPSQDTDPPSQNWTQTGMTEGFSGEKITSPQQHQSALKRLNRRLLIGGSLLGVCLLLAASFLLGKSLGTNQNGSVHIVVPVSTATLTQASATSVTATPTANPTLTPIPTQPSQAGTICETGSTDDWKDWQVEEPWKFLPTDHTLLLNDGSSASTLMAPDFCQPKVSDYAVEARIKLISGGCSSEFGVTVRGGYTGAIYSPHCGTSGIIEVHTSNTSICKNDITIDSSYHTYRVEARGNEISLLVDGSQVCSAADNQYLSPGQVGLFSNTQIEVTDFKVVPL